MRKTSSRKKLLEIPSYHDTMVHDEVYEGPSQNLMLEKKKESPRKLEEKIEKFAAFQSGPMVEMNKLDAAKENSIVVQEVPMNIEVPKRKILNDETNTFEAKVAKLAKMSNQNSNVNTQILQGQRNILMGKMLECMNNEQQITKMLLEKGKK